MRTSASEKGGLINRLLKIKPLTATWLGKAINAFARMLGRGGTTLPGRLALKIEPQISSILSRELTWGSLVISGTNGKTTTAALINTILNEAGMSIIHNQSGSNMSWGVASAFIASASLKARVEKDCAVMEVDEGAFPTVVKEIKPRGIIITNIFRDQLDRYGEIEKIQNMIRAGLRAQPKSGFRVINADDPSLITAPTNNDHQLWTYGLDMNIPQHHFEQSGHDLKTCPTCHNALVYDKIYFAHLGHYRCLSCSYKRPMPDISITDCRRGKNDRYQIQVTLPGDSFTFNFPLPGIYNLYNALAAIACAKAMNISKEKIISALEKAKPSFGRMENFDGGGIVITMALIKNPAGANAILRTILENPGKIDLLIAINDKIADGTDVSWLWDVDFEQLVEPGSKLSAITVSGLRALDMAVRLKYAGFDPGQIIVIEDTKQAVEKAISEGRSEGILIILPTYTAMLEIRRHLNKLGLGKPYWES